MNPNSLDAALPDFIKSCTALHQALMPAGMILLAAGFIFEFWHAPANPVELLKFLAKVFFIALLMTRSYDLINSSQLMVRQFVEQHVSAGPEKVAERFKAKLAEAQQTPEGEDQSFWDSLFSVDNWFQQIIAAALWLVSWIAMGLLFFVYTLQRACLLFCWCIGAVLFPTLAIRPISHLGLRHILRIAAIILWPVAIALASALSDGLLGVAADRNFLGDSGVVGAFGRGIISLLCLAVIAVWIGFSTIAGPVFLQRILTGGTGASAGLAQSGSLLANIGVASGFGLPSAVASARRMGQAAYVWGNRIWHRHRSKDGGSPDRPHPAPSPAPMPSPATGGTGPNWKPNPDDPTGDKAAKELANRRGRPFQRKS